jgi:choline dehydrogenase-like flavoprotein
MGTAVPVVRADGEGERRRFWGGGILTMKATADETGGAFLLFDDSMTQGKTTPLHIHAGEDEALYVLEGELLVHIDGTDHRLGAHGFAMAPRGVPHAFAVTSPTARVLTLLTPGSAEAFYRAASEPATADSDPAGTCRMGRPGAADTVVDADGRVEGVHGLRVADASILPTIPRANTHLTVLAVAEAMAGRLDR